MARTKGERRLGIVLAVGLLAMQVLIAVVALQTDVEGAWAMCIRMVLVTALIAETILLSRLTRAGRDALAYAVSFGSTGVVALLSAPLVLSW